MLTKTDLDFMRFRSLLRSLLITLCLALGLAPSAGAESINVGGTGSAEPIVRLLFEEFRKQAPDISLNIIDPPMGTGGALKAMSAGRLDLALVGRPLQPEESRLVGVHFDLADTPFVMASRDGQRRNGFTLDQLAGVYDGRLQKWDTGSSIRLVLRASFESDTLLLKSMSPAMDKAVSLSSQRPGMVMADNDLDAMELLTRTQGSLGPTTIGLLTSTGTRLAIFPINGVTPSIATLKNGSYPWRKTLSVVLSPRPKPAVESFAGFLRSGKARIILQRNDYLPRSQ